MVHLPYPIWVRDLAFFKDQPQNIVTATSYSQLRLYDTRAQRRPLFNELLGSKALTCVSLTPDGNTAIVGNTIGEIFVFDLRKRALAGKCKGKIVGSISAVSCHPTEPIFACSSIDRHCRVFDYNTRQLKFKVSDTKK